MNKTKTKIKILNEIKTGKIKMTPRWAFWLRDVGMGGGTLLAMLLAAIGLSIIIGFWKTYQPMGLAEYGEVGWELIKMDFPYLWLFGGLILILASVVLTSKIGDNYKRATKWVVVMTIFTVLLLTAFIVSLTPNF